MENRKLIRSLKSLSNFDNLVQSRELDDFRDFQYRARSRRIWEDICFVGESWYEYLRDHEWTVGYCLRNTGYGMPIDEEELDRIDLKHRLYTILLGEELYLAPIGDNPQQVLDLGTGSGMIWPYSRAYSAPDLLYLGIWAMDIADKFPSAEVLGVDLAPIQPQWCATFLWRSSESPNQV